METVTICFHDPLLLDTEVVFSLFTYCKVQSQMMKTILSGFRQPGSKPASSPVEGDTCLLESARRSNNDVRIHATGFSNRCTIKLYCNVSNAFLAPRYLCCCWTLFMEREFKSVGVSVCKCVCMCVFSTIWPHPLYNPCFGWWRKACLLPYFTNGLVTPRIDGDP